MSHQDPTLPNLPRERTIIVSPEVKKALEELGAAGGEIGAKLKGNWRIYEDPHLPKDQVLVMHGREQAAPFVGPAGKKLDELRGETKLDAGYIYAPYIPLQVTPTVPGEFFKKPEPKTPLEVFVEGVFAEEIEQGTLKPVRPEEPVNPCKEVPLSGAPFVDPNDFSLRKGIRTRYQKRLVNPNFFGTASVENL